MDEKYRTGKSFVETGPVRWTDKDSIFRPAIWVNHESILEGAAELEMRLNTILPRPTRITNLAASPKHLLFFICDLVAIFGPCPSEHVAFYVTKILGQNEISVPMFLGLACAMGLLKSIHSEDLELFYRPLQDGNLPVFHYTKKHLGIPTLRAKALSVIQSLTVADGALRELEKVCC